MKKQYKTLLIIVTVLAVLQIIGGIVYTSIVGVQEKEYTYVTCTVVEVETEQQEDESYIVKGITVTYENDKGEAVTATMQDFPSSFAEGKSFEARYKDNPLSLSAQKTDWFTPVFLLCLGVCYAIGAIVMFAMRKKMGLYALDNEVKNDDVTIDEDDWHIYDETADAVNKQADEEHDSASKTNPTDENSEELNQQKT